MDNYDVVVLGGGPAGLAAALASNECGGKTLIIEREKLLGGILKQCIHDGFGLIRFKEKLSGPEYSGRYIDMVLEKDIDVETSTFVTEIKKQGEEFLITIVNSKYGVKKIKAKAIVLANGCRERTWRQVFIQGTRPAGIYTAGTAQYFVNMMGYLPFKKCVVLGSGDIGLIMARRLTLEGCTVEGVYEAKSTPSGLSRNIAQCLDDFSIPLHLSHTVTRVFGDDRLNAVEISKVDEKMIPIPGTEKIVECDGLVLSVGLIPENEIAESLNIKIDRKTKGPFVDQNLMTGLEGVFSCGNALHVNDLVDYVSESGKIAGENAAKYAKEHKDRKLIRMNADSKFLYAVPQYIDINSLNQKVIAYFRSRDIRNKMTVKLLYDGQVIFSRKYNKLKPPEMERITFDISKLNLKDDGEINIVMEE